MKIERLKDADIPLYDQLAWQNGTLFNTTNWLRLFDRAVKLYGFYDDGSNLMGGYHLYEESRFALTICTNAPFTPGIGPFLRIDSQNRVVVMEKWKRALALMADHLENLSYAVVSISLNRSVVDTQPFIWKRNKVSPRYTYVIDLRKPLDEIWRDMSPERRRSITKGTKDGLITEQVIDHKCIKASVIETFLRQGKKINEYYLDKVLGEFAAEENSFAFVTRRGDMPIATSFCVHDAVTAYYLLGGYAHENKHHGAGPLCLWKSIEHGQRIGLKHFDFEGSMVPGIEKYFRGFGGELVPYYRISKAKLPLEMLLKLFKRDLF
ncbi:MAG: GNAT family N-acetyltransferase [Syntrophales bacterium]|jgi:hypothetical protein